MWKIYIRSDNMILDRLEFTENKYEELISKN